MCSDSNSASDSDSDSTALSLSLALHYLLNEKNDQTRIWTQGFSTYSYGVNHYTI